MPIGNNVEDYFIGSGRPSNTEPDPRHWLKVINFMVQVGSGKISV